MGQYFQSTSALSPPSLALGSQPRVIARAVNIPACYALDCVYFFCRGTTGKTDTEIRPGVSRMCEAVRAAFGRLPQGAQQGDRSHKYGVGFRERSIASVLLVAVRDSKVGSSHPAAFTWSILFLKWK